MADEQDIKIALLEAETKGLREQQKAHKEEISETLRLMGNTFNETMREIRGDIKNIYEFINRSKGSLTILVLGASALGGVTVAVLTWALGHFIR